MGLDRWQNVLYPKLHNTLKVTYLGNPKPNFGLFINTWGSGPRGFSYPPFCLKPQTTGAHWEAKEGI